MENEKTTEKYLRTRVKELGGTAYKFVSPGLRGVPDRLVILPGGKVFFAEIKSPGKLPTPLQKLQILRLQQRGHKVFVLKSRAEVDAALGAKRGE